MAFEPLDNEDLILQLVAEGDEVAFRQLYDHYRQRIYSFAVQLTKSEDRGDEIVQEVFLKVWTHRTLLRGIQNFNSWIYRMTRNIYIDALRKVAREQVLIKEMVATYKEEINPGEHLLRDKELRQLLRNVLLNLTVQQRTIFELSRVRGLSRQEIARELNISENTVKVHLTRALSVLRKHFGNIEVPLWVIILLDFLRHKA